MAQRAARDDGVRVTGTRSVTVDDTLAAREAYGWTTREFRIDCHTGRVIEGRWSGFPVVDLTAQARPSPETTHFVVSGEDGHRACVPVAVITDALLAFSREHVDVTHDDADGSENPGRSDDAVGSEDPGRSDDADGSENPGRSDDADGSDDPGRSGDADGSEDPGRSGDGTPRFLAQGVDSSHTVRDVASIEAVALDPDEDPRRYEITD